MEDLKCGLVGLARGVYDSIVGIGVVKTLDANQRKSAQRAADAASQPATALALRRAAVQALAFGASSSAVQQQHPSSPLRTKEEPWLLYRIFQCCLLNGGVFGLSIVSFNYMLLPAVQSLIDLLFGDHQSSPANNIWTWLHPLLNCTFQALWVIPLFVLSKIVNCLWFQDIANIAFRYITGGRPTLMTSVSRFLSDVLFSVLVQTLFLFQSHLVAALPIGKIGELVSLIHLSLLYSLYAFEYVWCSRGWELHRRLSFIEYNWPYFIGFGLPLAVLTSWPTSYFMSGSIFSILFPLYILSAHGVTPTTGTARFPLQLFSPSIWVSNAIFHRLTANCTTKPIRPTVSRQKRSVTREHRKQSLSPRALRPRTAATPS
ncbi:EI24 domain-containing protein tank [Dermacentor variabilis]|uniref:EI24 domain-containing protein tank n=1 Tax=Dermacentor variabilis TaxID=34621 RepID=UPI003F5AEDE3